jgi:5-(carboxyamino)imidazole ribonucleotide synthase
MIGAGQLARMTQQAAVDLGVELVVLAASPDDPAVTAGARSHLGSPQRLDDLQSVAGGADVVTFDHELVPSQHLVALERAGVRVRPSSSALELAQDKLHARRTLAAAGFPVPEFAEVASLAEASEFAERHGWPLVLKSPRGGYDGRGVSIVTGPSQLAASFATAGAGGAPRSFLAERHLELERELAVVVARRPGGELAAYPVIETRQVDGICVELVMPAPLPGELAAEATRLAGAVAELAGVTGVCAVELFCEPGGGLSVNELAMRPHNSGHATIEACLTSQFHQHLRAVLDWPLGDPRLVVPAAAMVNLIAADGEIDLQRRLGEREVGAAAVHLYGKTARPGRKLGHVTSTGATAEEALGHARRAAAVLMG